MKTIKKALIFMCLASGVLALALYFWSIAHPPWRLNRVAENRNAVVHIFNFSDGLSRGSGVIISRSGTILTAAHIASPGDILLVVTKDSRGQIKIIPASVGLSDEKSGFSLLFTSGGLPPPVSFGSTRDLREGDLVYTIGFPGQLNYPVVDEGIIANRNIRYQISRHRRSLLIRLTPVPGMSGSPVFNQDGELIGIFDAMIGQLTMNNNLQLWGVVTPTDPLTGIIKRWLVATGMPAPTVKR